MIICSCHALSEDAVRELVGSGPDGPRSPAHVHRCLGLRPQCGSCFPTIRALMEQGLAASAGTYRYQGG